MGHLTKYLQSQCFGLSLPSAIAATEDVKKNMLPSWMDTPQ